MNTFSQKNGKKRRKLKKKYFLTLLIVLSGTILFVGTSYSFLGNPRIADESAAAPKPKKPASTDETAPAWLEESKPAPEKNGVEPVEEPEEKPQTEPEEQSEPFPVIEPEEEAMSEEPVPRKVVYLTLDDGPSRWTERFLDVLRAHGVHATFFMQGSNLKQENLQESVRRAVREGHYIGGHSMTHDYHKLYTRQQFVPEMIETLSLVNNITGRDFRLVRAPYGSAPGLNGQSMRQQLADARIKLWDWTIDSRDWELPGNPTQVVQNIKQQAGSDLEVVLMHEKSQTLEALPDIIEFFRDAGYEFAVYNDTNHFALNFQHDAKL